MGTASVHHLRREDLYVAWQEVVADRPTGGTRRERQAYANGAGAALDQVAELFGLDLGEDPWDRYVDVEPDEQAYGSGE